MFKAIFAGVIATAMTMAPALAGEWVEGGLYVVPRDQGGYRPLKILKIEDDGVHLRSYSNVYPEPPAHIDESTLYMAGLERRKDEPLGMGHTPVSKRNFARWGAVFVQPSSVSEEELEGYQLWLEAEGGYF